MSVGRCAVRALRRYGAFFALEVRLQLRHGLAVVYLGVALVYVVILRVLPSEIRAIVAPLVILTDPAMIGFFFFGAFFLVERDAGILAPLAVAPSLHLEPLLARLISFGLTALLSAAAVVVFGAPELLVLPGFRPLAAAALVVVSAVLFGLFGYLVALGSDTLNAYMIRTAIPFVLISAPLLVFFPPTRSVLWLLLPSGGPAGLFAWSLGGVLPTVPWSPVAGAGATFAWLLGAVLLAVRAWGRARDRLIGVWA